MVGHLDLLFQSFRVFGEKVAEVPLVGTRLQYRRHGMCRILMNELEKVVHKAHICPFYDTIQDYFIKLYLFDMEMD